MPGESAEAGEQGAAGTGHPVDRQKADALGLADAEFFDQTAFVVAQRAAVTQDAPLVHGHPQAREGQGETPGDGDAEFAEKRLHAAGHGFTGWRWRDRDRDRFGWHLVERLSLAGCRLLTN